jgi:hypothetical protein
VNILVVSAIRTPHDTLRPNRCSASAAIRIRPPRVSSRNPSTREPRAAACSAGLASFASWTSASSPRRGSPRGRLRRSQGR